MVMRPDPIPFDPRTDVSVDPEPACRSIRTDMPVDPEPTCRSIPNRNAGRSGRMTMRPYDAGMHAGPGAMNCAPTESGRNTRPLLRSNY